MQFLAILRFWREAAIGALVIVAGLLWLNGKAGSARAAKWQTRSIETQAAFDQTVANYRAAAKQAQDLQTARNATIERDQNAVSLSTLEDYRKRLADLQSRYAGLVRAGTPKANSSPANAGGVPQVPAVPGGVDGSPARIGITAEQALLAEQIRLQLIALQSFVSRQQSIIRSATPPQ